MTNLSIDVENYTQLKKQYKRELSQRRKWQEAVRFRESMRREGYSEKDAFILMMHQYSALTGLPDPCPDIRVIPYDERNQAGPLFEEIKDGVISLDHLVSPKQKERDRNAKESGAEQSQVEPIPWEDMQWAYAHANDGSISKDHPPPSKGAIGLWEFARSYPDKFYNAYFRQLERFDEEQQQTRDIKRDARKSVEEIETYLSMLEDHADEQG